MTKDANESGEHERVKTGSGPVRGMFTALGYALLSLLGFSPSGRHETWKHPSDGDEQ